jgi:glycosyltransferase involved in cell wall biosynthesis
MIHVGLNLVYLIPGETGGMETYARELIPRLAKRVGLHLTAFVNREAVAHPDGAWPDVVPMRVVPVRSRNRFEWVRGEQQHVPRLAASMGCDLIHSLGSTAPLRGRVPRITTIHDLNYRKVAHAHFGIRGLGMRVLVPAAARRSRRIIVGSVSTRDDLVADLGIPPAKVDVVPYGVTVPSAPAEHAAMDARARFSLGERPVVLSVSAKRPHKNLARLIRALAAIPAQRRPVLVVPGYPTPYESELLELAGTLGLGRDVVMPAWVSPADLEGLYAAATCLVFPSLYEGFGLPVVEAMARGVPVATSDRGSLREVAGDAALLFDPEDVEAIRAGIERLLVDPEERARLRAAGRRRAAEFSWERTADLTLASYRKALTPGTPLGLNR